MRERKRSFRAVMLCILLVFQLFGWDNMKSLAATVSLSVDETLTVDSNTADNYYMNEGSTLKISQDVELSGYITGSGGAKKKVIENHGSITSSISMPDADITNHSTGNIAEITQSSSGLTVLNQGTIRAVHGADSVDNTETGTITTVDSGYGSHVDNKGAIENLNISDGTVDNTGSIGKVVFTSGGAFNMNGGNVTSITTGYSSNTISLKAGTIDSIESNSPITLDGDVSIKKLTCGNSVGGTGKAAVSDTLNVNYDNSATAATISVGKSTRLNFAAGAGIKVKYNEKTYTLTYADAAQGTLAELQGNTVSVNKGDYITATTPLGKKYLYGDTPDTAIYTAAEGYYFPENYVAGVTCDGTGIFNVNRSSSATVEFTYAPGSDEADKTITITLPAATAKEEQGEPAGIAGDVEKITGTTTKMEYAESATSADEDWISCTAGSTTVSVGTWYVRYKETDTQLAGAAKAVVVRKMGTGSISVADIEYGETLKPVVESDTNQAQIVEYKHRDADDSTYKPEKPTSVGKYTARVTFEENDTYVSAYYTDDFEIKMASQEELPGVEPEGVDAITGTTTEMEYASAGDAAAVWKDCLEDSTPVSAGTWYVRYKETDTHFAGEAKKVVVRTKGTGSISVADIEYGETLKPVVESDTYQIHTVEYKLRDADDSTYKSEEPVSVGKYTARVTFEKNDTYVSIYKTADFEITKASQGKPAGVELEGVDAITGTTTEMEYAPAGDAPAVWKDCSEGSTTVPVGTWYVRYKETDTHFAGEAKKVVVRTKVTGSISVADIAYGETLKPVVEPDTYQTYVVEYKLRDAEDSTYKPEKPVSVGMYTARVTFEKNDTYVSTYYTDDFEIKKASQEELPGVEPEGVDAITGTTTEMEYAPTEDAAEWKECSEDRTAVSAGTWYVRYKETDTHSAGVPVSVMVRTVGTGSISVADIEYGETLKPVVEPDTDQPYIVEYKLRDADDSTYKSEKPVSVGKYTARVTFEENDTYVSIYKTADFEITKASQEEPAGVAGDVKKITGTTTKMEYAATGDAAADEWTECSEDSTAVSVGTWYVRYKETDTHLAGAAKAVVVRTKGTGSIRVDDFAYGGEPNPVVESNTDQQYTIEYKAKGAADSAFVKNFINLVGEYVVRIIFQQNSSFVSFSVFDEFVITKALQGKPAGIAGETDAITGTTTKMEYAESETAADEDWISCTAGNTTVSAGVWYVRYKETDTHFAGVPAPVRVRTVGTGSIVVDDIAYGSDVKPVVKSKTYKTYKVEYKKKGASDYTDEVPVDVGEYTARVKFMENDTYASTTAKDNFIISKLNRTAPKGLHGELDTITGTGMDMEYAPSADAEEWVTCSENSTPVTAGVWYVRYKEDDTHFAGVPVAVRVKTNGAGTLQVSDVYYGGIVKSVVSSNTNQSYTVQYGKKGAAEYTSDVPVEVGEYTAKVTFEENATYVSSVVYDDFVISYLPLPDKAYTISGTIGDNGYYVSAIKIVAAPGYLVAETQDGNYVQSLEYSKVPETTRLFFMKQNTGERTAGISLPEIDIDKDLPVIDAIDNNVYYGNSIEVPVSDKNLKKITVNGKEHKFENDHTKLLLKAKGGISDYEIVVTDIAGNRNKIFVTVAAEWTKTGIIPSGAMVRLLTNNAYKLGKGTWQVEGDSTSYSGNQTFYVGNEGEYTFSNK